MPKRKDGQPNERDHSVWSTNQRMVIVTFPDRRTAALFDSLSDIEIEAALYVAMDEHYG